jgi:hypothetical protein
MANKLDEISVTIDNKKCDTILQSSQNHDFYQILRMISLRSPVFPVFAIKDRCDDQRGGGLCTYIRNTLDFLELKD